MAIGAEQVEHVAIGWEGWSIRFFLDDEDDVKLVPEVDEEAAAVGWTEGFETSEAEDEDEMELRPNPVPPGLSAGG